MGKPVKHGDTGSHNTRKRKQKNEVEDKINKENTDCNDCSLQKSLSKQVKEPMKRAPRVSKGKQKKSRQEIKEQKSSEETECLKTVGINHNIEMNSMCNTRKDEIQEFRGFTVDFSTRACEPKIRPHFVAGQNSVNFAHFLQNKSFGVRSSQKLCKSLSTPLVSMISELQLHRVTSPFDRRATVMDWHPRNPSVIAVGSKGGDMILWNIESTSHDLFSQGIGPGGSIQAMKFWPKNDRCLLTASVDGRVMLQDIEGKKSSIISDTMDSLDNWYCSVDVNAGGDVVLAGDNIGMTLLLSAQGDKLWSHRLHKSKVTHVEWSPREDWLFCTASCDKTVKFWDVRMIKGRESALIELKHNKPVNSAYFSLTDGCRLLTTDQKDELRVYRAPSWSLETTISHPHRFFQHITRFKAHWHPLQDLVVVGRYPDPNFQENDSRTIDVFDVPSGELVCQLQDSSVSGLACLNRFNPRGDCLASAMGISVLIWTRKEEVLRKQEILLAELKKKGVSASGPLANRSSVRGQGQNRPRSQTKQTKSKVTETKKTDVKTKLKTKQKR